VRCAVSDTSPSTLATTLAPSTIDLLPRAQIEVVVADDLVRSVISTVCRVARTGSKGDGKIFVLPLIAAIRIRMGEAGNAAL
jgi:nitrogen regulatory protein P-II 1